MAYDIIPIVILIGCLVGLAVMVGRKFPQIKTLDVDSMPAERELRLKQRLLASRLRRHLQGVAKFLGRVIRPLLRGMVRLLKKSYQRVLELESRYAKPAAAPTVRAGSITNQAEHLLAEAQRLRSGGQTAATEEHLMQLIALDPRHIAAYEMLGDMYLEAREFSKAREVYAYLVKMRRRPRSSDNSSTDQLAGYYLNLATAGQGLGHNAQALAHARKAATMAPNNPRVLDFLLKISIVVKDKALAQKTWQSLQQSDPQNAKLSELRAQIEELP